MSSTRLTPVAGPAAPEVRRVRHQARDAVTLMVFSLGTSLGLALLLLLVSVLLAPGS
ncbi:hypothetical protein ENKNEFLB_03220 [Nocardioides aquaticus]|jgi:hypothetical protein|uniref:Uncharacterized protein n=1 Tax=Nocardioides aquaticus TaxID=160826 RepID=A0ABX8EJX4_9ACTN|nr:hypothetical protein [Nocardioides aquaticus]QVT80819.1 hypothetical protein ENKNEFLB_03220 [Nocardioides aquaticus]